MSKGGAIRPFFVPEVYIVTLIYPFVLVLCRLV